MDRDAELALIQRCRAGDREALGSLVVKYHRQVYNATYRVVGNTEDAYDLTQTTFLKAIENIGSFDERFRFFSWIYRIAINESLNHVRRSGRETATEIDEPAPESTEPDAEANRDEVCGKVQAALMKLKVEDRVVLILRHFGDCTYREMADILDVPEKTVKSRLYSARQRLHDLLETWQAGRT